MSTNENSAEYQAGYRAAMEDAKRDLAAILRIQAVGTGDPDEERISDQMVRDIFAGTFGVMAMDQEFGTEPTGRLDSDRAVEWRVDAVIRELGLS